MAATEVFCFLDVQVEVLYANGNNSNDYVNCVTWIPEDSGDLFILVYSIDNRGSYQEVCHLREQILECKKQCAKDSTKQRRTKLTPMVIVGSKCDKEKEREVHEKEVRRLVEGQPNCDFIESSAKKNINIDEIFVKLFDVADLPLEMSPSLHRKVPHTYVGSNSPTQKRGMSIRRKLSDACGTIAPNVRRPSIRTDLLVAQLSGNRQVTERDEPREQKCLVQ